MTIATSYLCFGCVEVAHNARTRAYHAWACQTGRYTDPCIPRLGWVCECPEDGDRADYSDPATDGACWYDPLIPESTEFLGVIITKVGGVRSSSFKREAVPGVNGGSILQKPLIEGKQMVVEGIILATTCAGMDYGLEWLRRQFEDDQRCPQSTECVSCQGSQMALRVHCADDALDSGLHVFDSVGTIDGVDLVEDDYPMGQRCCCTMRRFTVTLQTESAYSRESSPTETASIAADSASIFTHLNSCDRPPADECCPICMDSACDRCTVDPGCDCFSPYVLKPTTIAETPCFCEPPCFCTGAVETTFATSGYEMAMRLSLFAGIDPYDQSFQKYGMRNTVIRVWENPDLIALPSDEDGYDLLASRRAPCAEIGVSWMPAGSTLVLDGASGRSWLKCDGRCVDHSSRVFTISGSMKPLVTRCMPMIVTVEWDCLNHVAGSGGGIVPSSLGVESFLRFRL